MRAQERMGHSSMSEGWRNHTSPAQERVNWVMDEVMSGRMSREEGMAMVMVWSFLAVCPVRDALVSLMSDSLHPGV